jgi:UDP-N-acetylglucosamine 3-dehydrogenase
MSTRFAVIGCGNAAREIHVPGVRAAEGADITVFTSRTRASAQALRDEWGAGDVVDNWEDAVTRDDVDAVLIAVPNAFHHDIAVAAAKAGKHVLVDKPMACTTADADAMIAAADTAGVVLVPFHNTRFAAPFVAAAERVAAGDIGSVTGFRFAFGHGGPQTWAPRAEWFFDTKQSGGGCLIDLGVHAVDLVRSVTGDDIVAVSAALNGQRGDVEADAQLVARLRGGAIGSIHASWSSPSGPDHQLTVIGTSGTLHLDNRTPLTLIDGNGQRERVTLPDITSSPLAELLWAIRGEREPSITAADGRAAVAIVQAAYRSAANDSTMTEVV